MQLSLLPKTWSKDRFAFGGALLKGSHPKTKRIFRAALPLHIVIRSTKARGALSLLLHGQSVAQILESQAARHQVRIFAAANAGNHLHLLVQAGARERLSNFLRAITGRIAQLLRQSRGFWDARPFSRIVAWGRDFKNVARYIGVNSTEMTGMSRASVRAMFEKIQLALRNGKIPRAPGLIAAGFG